MMKLTAEQKRQIVESVNPNPYLAWEFGVKISEIERIKAEAAIKKLKTETKTA